MVLRHHFQNQLLRAAPRRRRGVAVSSATAILKGKHSHRGFFLPLPHPYPHKYQQTACRLSILARGGQPRIGSQIKVCPVWGVCQWAEGEEGRSGDSEGRFEPGKRIKQPRKIFTAEKSILLEVVGGRVSGELLCSSVSILIRTHES